MNATRERPILFNGEMVRAILDGRKTQTRRIAKMTGNGHVKEVGGHRRWHPNDPEATLACPLGQAGDRLWVRETWRKVEGGCIYDAAGGVMDSFDDEILYRASKPNRDGPWRPSIHMPRWASRITLEIVSVRLQRLQNISEDDAYAEGVSHVELGGDNAREGFKNLWKSINGNESWDSNPWVWALTFEQVK